MTTSFCTWIPSHGASIVSFRSELASSKVIIVWSLSACSSSVKWSREKKVLKKGGRGEGGIYQFNPGLIVCRRYPAIAQLQLPRARCLVVRPRPVCGARLAVLCSEADVEGPEHGDVDGEAGQHELNGAEHEGGERGSGQVTDEVDLVDYDCLLC